MNLTIREVISQVKIPHKAVNADSRMTNKYVYSLLKKHRNWLLKQVDSKFNLFKLNYLFQTLKCVSVIPVSTIDDDCGIKVGCKIYRTRTRVPEIVKGYNGLIIRSVSSIDGFSDLTEISSQQWNRMQENPDILKYDKGEYYFIRDGFLYFPNLKWKKVQIEAYFEEDVSTKSECGDKPLKCPRFLDTEFKIPEDLLAQCVDSVNREIAAIYQQVPDENQIDKNPTRRN